MMPVLPASALDTARSLSEAHMPDTCTRTIPGAWVDDGEGGGVYGEPTTESFPCRTARPGSDPDERLVAEQMTDPAVEVMRFPLSAALSADETVTITRARDGSAQAYDVVNVLPLTTYDADRKAVIRKTG